MIKIEDIDDKIIFNLQFFDTRGNEISKSIRKNFGGDVDCAIIVYDITSKSSLDSVDNWLAECDLYSKNDNLIKNFSWK